MKWLTLGWWQYLFAGATGMRNVWCRAKGHPNGTIYFNATGLEPDNRCRDCDEVIA